MTVHPARTARRAGSEVTVIYRRERKDMPAIPDEIEAAEHEGVQFLFLAAPHRVVGDKQGAVKAIEVVKTKLGEFDTSGRRRPVPTDEVVRVDCESVILAVGEKVDPEFAAATGLEVKKAGTLEVDRYSLETSRERSSRARRHSGASNVSGMGYGKKAARNIDKRLMGVKRFPPLAEFDYAMELDAAGKPRGTCRKVAAAASGAVGVESPRPHLGPPWKRPHAACAATSAASTTEGAPAARS
jgi:NADPH-dependent glutamate synthase beta subunit-like oxidoreductase